MADQKESKAAQELRERLGIKSYDKVYISGRGVVHPTAEQAISDSLQHEDSSNTGAGCSQSPDNVSTPSKK